MYFWELGEMVGGSAAGLFLGLSEKDHEAESEAIKAESEAIKNGLRDQPEERARKK